MVGPIFNLFFLNVPHSILNRLVRLACSVGLFGLFGLFGSFYSVYSICSVYSVDKMYLELNEEHFKKEIENWTNHSRDIRF